MHWLKPELVAEIEFAGWTGDGMVRQAAFKGLREDKPAEEVEAEKPRHGEPTDRMTGAATSDHPRQDRDAARVESVVMGVADLPSRQGAVARRRRRQARHQARSGALLRSGRRLADAAHQGPALLDHPRAGRHRAASNFFQRHAMPGSPNLLELVKVSGDRKPYLQIDRVEALAAVGAGRRRSNCIPGTAQPGQPESPGRLVFDLDPAPDVDFRRGDRGGDARCASGWKSSV